MAGIAATNSTVDVTIDPIAVRLARIGNLLSIQK
jgi:hypothetical protein